MNKRTGPKPRPVAEKFWEKVEKTPGCWIWTASKHRGYGQFTQARRPFQKRWAAHRLSWVMLRGEIPTGFCVLHKCDNPSCVRPTHLFLGTLKDNSQDMARKGRSTHGERNTQSKLNADSVRLIRKLREDGFTYRQLADRFNVTTSPIRDVCKRITWKRI